MSSPEVERFEVTEGDMEQIFDPGARRFRQSKNKATYGKNTPLWTLLAISTTTTTT